MSRRVGGDCAFARCCGEARWFDFEETGCERDTYLCVFVFDYDILRATHARNREGKGCDGVLDGQQLLHHMERGNSFATG